MAQQVSGTLRRTPLYAAHLAAGARMVPFAGWQMPLQYASILGEVRAVRASAGAFDVSHMGRLWLEGPDAGVFLQRVLTADVRSLGPGRVRYCFLLNEGGGIIDDVVLSHLGGGVFLLVCNAANHEVVVDWLGRWRGAFQGMALHDRTEETVMLSVQGPSAMPTLDRLTGFFRFSQPPSSLRHFQIAQVPLRENGSQIALVSRSGYTGEDGVEVVLPASDGVRLWAALRELGATPCGLGARDVLRLEAGLSLHGNDIDPTTTPLEAGLERFVAPSNTEFVGHEALERQRGEGIRRRLVGFRMLERGIPRHGYLLLREDGAEIGVVTSGGYSPTLDTDIGMGYVAVELATPGQRIAVDIRQRQKPAQIVPLPFYTRKR